MDNYDRNMIAGWVLAALIALLGLSIISSELFRPAPVTQPGFVVEGVEVAGAEAEAPAAELPITALLASASIERGENQFKKCAACHTIERGGAQGIGPNLWGIVGARHAHIAGFAYSDALKATADKLWDWESLSEWLRNPRAYLPGNKMSFAGLSKAQDRADLLLYLNSKSDQPKPIPAAPAAEPAAEPATAEAPAGPDTPAAPPA